MKWRRDGVSCRESCKWNGKGNPNNRAQRVKIFEATPLHQLMKRSLTKQHTQGRKMKIEEDITKNCYS
ncbi:hypothetical protein QG37_04465 [Candidozyma auris]|uniref:Uncharacterized protein n=1 Tax=Candidozyma auris TaxID=498019 RepID=A0A0L0NX44_CANAR|nr:hypothetical protein QG37_04465 [[Candida] auris]